MIWKHLVIREKTLGTFQNDFRKQTSVKFDHVLRFLRLFSFLFWQECSRTIRASIFAREKTDFPREHYHFSSRRIAAAMCRLSIREPAPFSSSNQEPRSGWRFFSVVCALRFLCFFLFSRAGAKTPLTKVNSHDQPLFTQCSI